MRPTDQPRPADGADEHPVETLELTVGRPTSGAWLTGGGPRAVFVCQLLSADKDDAEVEIHAETRDEGGAANGAETLLPSTATRPWVLRGRGVHREEFTGLRDHVRLVYLLRSACMPDARAAGPIRVRLLRVAWDQGLDQFVWFSPWIPVDPRRPQRPALRVTFRTLAIRGWVHFTTVHPPRAF